MIKEISVINFEIVQLQRKELEYKGVLNQDLYLTGLSVDSLTLMKSNWKGRNITFLKEFINKAIEKGIPRVIITNNYDDWNVAAYIQ